VNLAGVMILIGQFDEGERWLQRTGQALQSDTGPDVTLLLRLGAGMLSAGRGRHEEALTEFSTARRLQQQLVGSHALENQLTGWTIATQARAGRLAEARAALAALDDERAGAGEICNAALQSDTGLLGRAARPGTAPAVGWLHPLS